MHEWTELILPIIAEDEGDILGRKPGELLWPARFTADDFPSVERGEISTRSFAALYQQRPVPAGGSLIKFDWFDNRYPGGLPRRKIIENTGPEIRPGVYLEYSERDAPLHLILAIDCASKTGIHNDFSALVTIASDEIDFFVVDVVRERLEFTDLTRRIIEVHQKFGHQAIYVEDASAGIAIVQELRRWTGLPVIPITPERSKIARVESWTGFFEARRVRVPQSAHWLDAYLAEMCAFPNGRHDDMVDATILGLSQMDRFVGRAQTSEYYAQRLSGWMAR